MPSPLRSEDHPEFIIFAGMPRTGTTSLFHLLAAHPSICTPFRKEMGYFLFNHHRGLQWYLRSYQSCRIGRVGIDVTPEYFFSRTAIRRMQEFPLPLKVVMGVRDPVEFTQSLYQEYGKRFGLMPSFEQFLEEFSYRRGPSSIDFRLAEAVIPRMISAYRQAFGDRLLLYDYSLFRTDPVPVLSALEAFVGIPPFFGGGAFKNLYLNTSDRRNLRILSQLLGHERFAAALGTILPRRLLVYLARTFYTLSRRRHPRAPGQDPVGGLPPPFLVRQREQVKDLFSEGRILLGTGRPFLHPTKSGRPPDAR